MSEADFIYIDSNAQLADVAEQCTDARLLALDTEFQRETTFYPIAGLIQLGNGQRQYLIDPLTIDDWAPLQTLLNNSSYKLLHACSEDLEVFARLCNALPQPLLDTQIGAALAGFGFSLSYQALVKVCLDIEVGKEQTRSDWLRRPLSAEQCHYAALDVAYLPPIFEVIAERLQQKNRFDWWLQEGAGTIAASRDAIAPEHYYLKLSGGWRLRGAQVAVLRELCAWREREARRRNVPRGRIVKDAQCIDIARLLPRSAAELSEVPELHSQTQRVDGESILSIVEIAQQMPASDWPAPPAAPLPREWGDRLKKLRQLIDERARELDIPAELLARKRDCEMLLRTGELSDSLRGWRLPIVGEPLLALYQRI